ncbi:MAG: hypothetical protein IJ783_06230 [Kiritimatiellae bacterium]|nr:hypothetical protein [Kiritimatiellia bacterium]
MTTRNESGGGRGLLSAMKAAARAGARRRAAFSLIEVCLALVVVGGGLVAVFSLFPIGLRQGAQSRGDLSQASFASALLETISARARQIDDLATWEDAEKWWSAVVKDTNLAGNSYRLQKGKSFSSNSSYSLRAREAAGAGSNGSDDVNYNGASGNNVFWYVCREEDKPDFSSAARNFVLPPQFLVRVVKIERKARAFKNIDWNEDEDNGESYIKSGKINVDLDEPLKDGNTDIWLPSRYVVSVVSSDKGYPAPYVNGPVFSQEYAFVHRP